MKMTLEDKNNIRARLERYCARYTSQNRAAASLKGVSAGTVSTIINGKFDNISDDMFKKIAAQIAGGRIWSIAETKQFREITFYLSESQSEKTVGWIVAPAGTGKTKTAEIYTQEHRDVFYLLCARDMSKADFIRELARIMGLNTAGLRVRGILQLIINEATKLNDPLFIFDEADKLNDNVFAYFIDIYNRLRYMVGMVFLSTSHIRKRIDAGLRLDKPGYQEFFSRIGRKFIEVSPVDAHDVASVCMANGVTDKGMIATICDLSEVNDSIIYRRSAKRAIDNPNRRVIYDIRRVEDAVRVLKRKEARLNAN